MYNCHMYMIRKSNTCMYIIVCICLYVIVLVCTVRICMYMHVLQYECDHAPVQAPCMYLYVLFVYYIFACICM